MHLHKKRRAGKTQIQTIKRETSLHKNSPAETSPNSACLSISKRALQRVAALVEKGPSPNVLSLDLGMTQRSLLRSKVVAGLYGNKRWEIFGNWGQSYLKRSANSQRWFPNSEAIPEWGHRHKESDYCIILSIYVPQQRSKHQCLLDAILTQ